LPAGPIWTLTLVSVAALLLLAWAFLPLPNEVGGLTMLSRAAPTRVPLALGLAAIVQAAAASMIHPRFFWSAPWLIGAAALTAVTALWANGHLPWDSSLSVVAVASWSLVNPLQRGLGGVLTDPLVTELRSVTAARDNPRVEVFGDFNAVAKVRIAGLQSLSGTTLHPDIVLMAQLAPGQEALWNNYAQYLWAPGPSGSPAVITQVKGTLMTLDIDPCDPVLLDYADPGWVVSATALAAAPCLHEVSVVHTGNGKEFRIYRVSNP
jgi:hypothetical protein